MLPGASTSLAFLFREALRKVLPVLLSVFALALPAAPMLAAPQVVVSIRPLQLLAAAITEGATNPKVVWGQGQDPHHVSLRPSERRLLADADVLLWIGPMLERPLAGLVGELDAKVLTVQELGGLELITVDGQPDPHAWLDTRNARLIAASLAMTLAELDAVNAARYRDNLTHFSAALAVLEDDLTRALGGADAHGWAVYHHALRYLEREFELPPPLMLADSENNAPGIRTARQVRAELEAAGITCMLVEPGVNREEVSTMLDLPALQLVEADVMGRGAAAQDYIAYMRALAATVSACLRMAP
jgi:zinc transport system substrate-binding protein